MSVLIYFGPRSINMASRFCLVISSQRSGSTLLCRDLGNLELLGAPDEYAIPIFHEKNDWRESFQLSDYERLLNKIHGICDGIDIYSYKIMLNYGIRVISGCLPSIHKQIQPAKSSDAYADFFVEYVKLLEKNYDQVFVFINTRKDLISQVHSRVIAESTDEWHLENNTKRRTKINIDKSILFERMLRKLPEAVIEFNTLNLIGQKLSSNSNVLCVDYSDLVDLPTWESTLYSFLGANGIATEKRLHRSLQKIVDKDLQISDCSAFKAWVLRQFRIL